MKHSLTQSIRTSNLFFFNLDLFHVDLDLDKQYKDLETRNILVVENYQTNNTRLFKIPEKAKTLNKIQELVILSDQFEWSSGTLWTMR